MATVLTRNLLQQSFSNAIISRLRTQASHKHCWCSGAPRSLTNCSLSHNDEEYGEADPHATATHRSPQKEIRDKPAGEIGSPSVLYSVDPSCQRTHGQSALLVMTAATAAAQPRTRLRQSRATDSAQDTDFTGASTPPKTMTKPPIQCRERGGRRTSSLVSRMRRSISSSSSSRALRICLPSAISLSATKRPTASASCGTVSMPHAREPRELAVLVTHQHHVKTPRP